MLLQVGGNLLQVTLIEVRIDFLDALENRRMRGKHPRHAVGEEHMRGLLRVRGRQCGAVGKCRDLDERFLQTIRIASELHTRCIGKSFPLTRHRSLQQAAEEQPDITEHHDRDSHGHETVTVASAARRELQQHPPDQCDHEQTEHPAHELNIQAHVAVEDVAEFVRDNALKLVAAEIIECALSNGHSRVRGRVTGRESVDCAFLFEDVDLRHRHAGRNRHFLHDVVQTLALQITRVAADSNATQRARHYATAAAQLQRFVHAGQAQNRYDGQSAEQRPAGILRGVFERCDDELVRLGRGENGKQHRVKRQSHREQ